MKKLRNMITLLLAEIFAFSSTGYTLYMNCVALKGVN